MDLFDQHKCPVIYTGHYKFKNTVAMQAFLAGSKCLLIILETVTHNIFSNEKKNSEKVQNYLFTYIPNQNVI